MLPVEKSGAGWARRGLDIGQMSEAPPRETFLRKFGVT